MGINGVDGVASASVPAAPADDVGYRSASATHGTQTVRAEEGWRCGRAAMEQPAAASPQKRRRTSEDAEDLSSSSSSSSSSDSESSDSEAHRALCCVVLFGFHRLLPSDRRRRQSWSGQRSTRVDVTWCTGRGGRLTRGALCIVSGQARRRSTRRRRRAKSERCSSCALLVVAAAHCCLPVLVAQAQEGEKKQAQEEAQEAQEAQEEAQKREGGCPGSNEDGLRRLWDHLVSLLDPLRPATRCAR